MLETKDSVLGRKAQTKPARRGQNMNKTELMDKFVDGDVSFQEFIEKMDSKR
jgi:hypothetical protein